MSESPVLSKISAAFAPYLRQPDELYLIRAQIAAYVDSLKPQIAPENTSPQQYPIPRHVTGVRQQYLETLHRYHNANQQYAKLREQLRSQAAQVNNTDDPAPDFQTHLELLQLRRLYQKYEIISHFLKEGELLATKHQVFNPPKVYNVPLSSSNETDQAELSSLLARYKELDRNLDVAILRADHQLKREKQLFEKCQSQESLPEHQTSDAKFHALVVTNAELTNWIGESLAKCDSGSETPLATHDHLSRAKHDTIDYERAIDQQYEKYLEARQRLLNAAAALSPSQSSSEHEPLAIPHPTKPPQTQQAKRELSNASITSVLPSIKTIDIPHQFNQQNLTLAQHRLEDLLQKHKQSLKEQLLRLHDESHLLPSYPILATSKKEEQELDDIEKLLRGWIFAMEAAGTATNATADKQIIEGQKAIDEVHEVLDGLMETKGMWEKLNKK